MKLTSTHAFPLLQATGGLLYVGYIAVDDIGSSGLEVVKQSINKLAKENTLGLDISAMLNISADNVLYCITWGTLEEVLRCAILKEGHGIT